jgi:hypothetical protein
MYGFDDMSRLVRRNDDTVKAVFVNGKPAWSGGALCDGVGERRGFGTVLGIGE